MRPTRLLMANGDLRARLALRHAHVLVDEYQDVNRASARMLMELYREGSELWVVGDARQSLYRWRGASSANMVKFEVDFIGGKRKALDLNYRSTDHIASLSRRFAGSMAAGKGGLAYQAEANRKEEGTKTRLLVGVDDHCEAELLVEEVKALQERGVRFADQVVLAPTNSRLDLAAAALARHSIPTSHLGSFFEREEVRDLLSILALVSEPNGGALVRLGALEEIAVSQTDIAILIRAARAEGEPLYSILSNASSIAGISDGGGAALEKLGSQIEGFTIDQSAFDMVATWLFDRSDYLRSQSNDKSAQGALVRAAICRLLGFLDQSELSGRPITAGKALLRVRRAILLADDRDLRDANLGRDVDAVRLMTIHGSKGLEFKAVHIVGLYDQCLPGPFKRHGLPLPDGMIEEETRESHIEEEECAFFVAISRAEDHLRLYHSEKANVRARKCSPFVIRIGPFEKAGKSEAVFPRPTITSSIPAIPIDQLSMADVRDFTSCPLKVGYRWFFGIEGRRYESPYLKTSGVLYQLVDRLHEVAGPDLKKDLPELFEEVWNSRGPVEHDLAADYKVHAKARADRLGELAAGYASLGDSHIRLPLSSGKLKIVAPLIRTAPEGTELRFFDSTRVKTKTGDDLTAGLFAAAAKEALGRTLPMSIAHVADKGIAAIRRPAAKIQTDVEEAGQILSAIARGELQPKTNSVICARCPHFVACPATGTRGEDE
jgi:DNA helicase II / ATP-dependent DNA helicase PcrA